MRSAALAATLAAVVGARPARRCVEVPHVRTRAGAPLPLGTKPAWCCCQYHRRRGSAPLTPPGHRSVPGHRVERGTHIPSPCARQGVWVPDWRREHRDGRSRPIFGWFWARRRGDPPADDAPILGGLNDQSVARRLAAAARAVGIEGRITGHSGRVGLASEIDGARRHHHRDHACRRLENRPLGRPLTAPRPPPSYSGPSQLGRLTLSALLSAGSYGSGGRLSRRSAGTLPAMTGLEPLTGQETVPHRRRRRRIRRVGVLAMASRRSCRIPSRTRYGPAVRGLESHGGGPRPSKAAPARIQG